MGRILLYSPVFMHEALRRPGEVAFVAITTTSPVTSKVIHVDKAKLQPTLNLLSVLVLLI